MNRASVTTSVFLLIFVVGLAGAVSGNADWIGLSGQTSPAKPQAEVLISNDLETIVRFTIPGFWSGEMIEDNTTYRVLEFPGYAGTLETGKPQLPVISELIAIPASCNVAVQILDYSEQYFSGYNVYPFQTPLREDEERKRFEIDRAQYSSNSFYPESMAEVGEPGIWRDLRVVNLRVCPLQYNAVTGELKAYSQIIVRLEYSGVSDTNVKLSPSNGVTPNYDRMYRGAVLNYSELGLEIQTTESNDSYDYLIIAADGYVNNMRPFAAWKNNVGLKTRIVPTSEIGTHPKEIKKYIADQYYNSGIRYVLLVGNETDIPGDLIFGVFSDYNYALIDGHDYYADVAIGRFAGDNDTHIDNMVKKTITFESKPPEGDWLNKSLLVANWQDAPGKYQLCLEQIRTAAQTDLGYYAVLEPDFTTAYGAAFENGGDEASNQDVIGYINEGFRLVNYRGHGHQEAWYYWNVHLEHFRLWHVDSLNNGQMTPVVFSIACVNADLNYDTTTIAEAFTQRDDGAVAYLGATAPSYTTPNHDYDKQLYKCVFDEGINAVGDASNEASMRVIELWDHWGLQNAYMYLWLGDPSLQLIHYPQLSGSFSSMNAPSGADGLPTSAALMPNYPNPFNPSTEISFSLPHACHVNLDVFNIVGQKVTSLVNREMEAGYHTVSFDGSQVASGTYLYRLQAGDFVDSKKMILVK